MDADNRFLWRATRQRLDAESLRDALLSVSGRLDARMFGPSAQQFWFKDDHSPTYDYTRFDVDSAEARRRGVGGALMQACEVEALRQGRWLLTLDTVINSAGEALYTALGWQRAGPIPDYALMPDGSLCTTMFMWKRLT